MRAKEEGRRTILRTGWIAAPAPFVILALAYYVAPTMPGLDEPIARLALALRWLVVAMLPYIAVCAKIASARFREGSFDPTRGEDSATLRLHCRTMTNTLEQLVWFAINLLALAPMLSPSLARLLPVACVLFALSRTLYWWGYLRNETLGRAPGVQTTFGLNGVLTVAALVFLIRS